VHLRLALLLSVACAGGESDPPVAPAPATAPTPAPSAEVSLETDDDKTLYALGLSVGQSLAPFSLTPAEADRVLAGLEDALAGRPPRASLAEYGPRIEHLARARGEAAAGVAREKSGAFLGELASQPGAVKTPSGLVYLETQAGTGPSPTPANTVKVHYRGTLHDGQEFDSSYARNEPIEFPLGQVVPCWTEGLQKMKVGGKAKLGCPAELAYGDQGAPGIPGGSALLFEVELLAIQ
jgi:FKBP-type peptidyl-prolyl cis-trans isomerase FkpA